MLRLLQLVHLFWLFLGVSAIDNSQFVELAPKYCEVDYGKSDHGFRFLIFSYPEGDHVQFGYDLTQFSLRNYFMVGEFITAGVNNAATYFNSTDPDAQFDGVTSLYQMGGFTFIMYGVFFPEVTGMYKFQLEASNGATVQIGAGKDCCGDLNSNGVTKELIEHHDRMDEPTKGSIYLEKDKPYPIRITLFRKTGPVIFKFDLTDPFGEPVEFNQVVMQEPEYCKPHKRR
ncbi:hypothetical protein DASB73_008670 [Starmerella bacillaris]|uniref:PA14 domain-containing protein n=1 Tax=Starmerella bacillaris TaxID=1247836 RepID=A0AAV5RHA7_STABA|nr:hypothetical protein DASB73_008670 [Starmerella bacillaris]